MHNFFTTNSHTSRFLLTCTQLPVSSDLLLCINSVIVHRIVVSSVCQNCGGRLLQSHISLVSCSINELQSVLACLSSLLTFLHSLWLNLLQQVHFSCLPDIYLPSQTCFSGWFSLPALSYINIVFLCVLHVTKHLNLPYIYSHQAHYSELCTSSHHIIRNNSTCK